MYKRIYELYIIDRKNKNDKKKYYKYVFEYDLFKFFNELIKKDKYTINIYNNYIYFSNKKYFISFNLDLSFNIENIKLFNELKKFIINEMNKKENFNEKYYIYKSNKELTYLLKELYN